VEGNRDAEGEQRGVDIVVPISLDKGIGVTQVCHYF
jgi:hypothetical protein